VNEGQWHVPLLATLPTVATEALAPTCCAASSSSTTRATRGCARRYMSCASCHNDGGHDGRVWDLTGFGEGLRNTISLRGRAGAPRLPALERQLRRGAGLRGPDPRAGRRHRADDRRAFNTGTRSQPLGDPKAGLSADLDALAAYVARSTASTPARSATAAAAR
jgi:cytochrome c553